MTTSPRNITITEALNLAIDKLHKAEAKFYSEKNEAVISDLESLMSELDNKYQPLPRRPEGFGITIKEYYEARNKGKKDSEQITEKIARFILKKAVKDGLFIETIMLVNGYKSNVYSKAVKKG